VRGANSNAQRPPRKNAGGLGDPTSETRQAGPTHHFGAGHKHVLVDFSSRSTPVGAVSLAAPRSPETRGHAGLVRRARTYPWWETTGQFSPPKPRRTWVTIGLLPACIPGTPRRHQRQQVPQSVNAQSQSWATPSICFQGPVAQSQSWATVSRADGHGKQSVNAQSQSWATPSICFQGPVAQSQSWATVSRADGHGKQSVNAQSQSWMGLLKFPHGPMCTPDT
jgi:hypothetical protein